MTWTALTKDCLYTLKGGIDMKSLDMKSIDKGLFIYVWREVLTWSALTKDYILWRKVLT